MSSIFNLKNKNKKGGVIGIIMFIALLFAVLIIGFIMSTGGAVVQWTADTVMPELTTLGAVEGVNFTSIADQTLVPLNGLLGNINWFVGVLYFMMLMASIGFAVYSRFNPERWLLGFYFVLMILLVMGSILISNIYEDFYTGTSELAVYLQSQTLLSFMIIQAPLIFTLIGFLTGIIIFSGLGQEVSA